MMTDAHTGPNAPALLQVEHLRKVFGGRSGILRRQELTLVALDDVSFTVQRGETVGLVGESGSGKSTLARCVLRLIEPTGGRVSFDGIDVTGLGREGLRLLRRRMQIVFQDPYASLNPRMSVSAIVEEPILIHFKRPPRERVQRVREVLELVGIIGGHLDRKPHELSGGQRQRIALARALVLQPDLLILDEPVSALDVSIQAQVLNLLKDLQDRLHLTYVFITHDLAVAEYFCNRVAVVYLGAIVETASAEHLFRTPLHPYSAALLSAAPDAERAGNRDAGRRIVLRGEAALEHATTEGCPFQPRCPVGRDRELCGKQAPLLETKKRGHMAACHYPGEIGEVARHASTSEPIQ